MGKRQSLAYADRAAAVIAEPANAVGRIRKTYGGGADDSKNGALLATLYDTFPESFDTAEPLWVEIDSLAVPLFIASLERRGAASAVVSFDDFGRAEEAELLVGKVLYAERDNVRDEEGTDFEILIGYELTDRTTGRRGTVTATLSVSLAAPQARAKRGCGIKTHAVGHGKPLRKNRCQ